MNPTLPLRVAASLGFLGVCLGAFGAHGLEPRLTANGRVDDWNTAVLYHLVHAVVLLFVAGREQSPKAAFWLFALGIVIFSGSLYVLALTNMLWLGAITPIGGLCFLAGWLTLVIKPR